MSAHDQSVQSLEWRATQIVAHLPPGSFTVDEFIAHALGINALANTRDVGPMLKYLADNEVIRRIETPQDLPARWVLCGGTHAQDLPTAAPSRTPSA